MQQVYENSVDGRVFTVKWCITMRVILNHTPSIQGTMGLPRMCTQPVGDVRVVPPWSCTGCAAMELYSYVQRVYDNSVDGSVFTAEWCITMRVIPSRTPSVQGATGLYRMCTQPVGDVRGPPPWSCTSPYSLCTKIPLMAECLTASSELL